MYDAGTYVMAGVSGLAVSPADDATNLLSNGSVQAATSADFYLVFDSNGACASNGDFIATASVYNISDPLANDVSSYTSVPVAVAVDGQNGPADIVVPMLIPNHLLATPQTVGMSVDETVTEQCLFYLK